MSRTFILLALISALALASASVASEVQQVPHNEVDALESSSEARRTERSDCCPSAPPGYPDMVIMCCREDAKCREFRSEGCPPIDRPINGGGENLVDPPRAHP
eukprot:TRINITY_DN4494_c0_g1_i2.p1 TRINITY_DN4494_c0_g1~~TRINITY_DN4494_c0_g1_i2.p1  ORF type:complete len:103 (+),score=10.31 TRINITY_DN4494_c0_g1_i2:193-501(+)